MLHSPSKPHQFFFVDAHLHKKTCNQVLKHAMPPFHSAASGLDSQETYVKLAVFYSKDTCHNSHCTTCNKGSSHA